MNSWSPLKKSIGIPSPFRLFDHSCVDRIWLIIGLGVLVRLVFMGYLNLLPEEAYYWNYAQHLDIGYLDHPPMVAWLIHACGVIFGRSEFAVRFPAFLGWFVMAFFVYRLARNTVSTEAGKLSVMFLAVLPIYMSVGFLMTPDAPFYACWAGALYFLERAIIGHRPRAWYYAGLFLGLGLLSKYTMGLIVPATLAFLVLDKRSRYWFTKPQPYLAILIGLVLFSPVVYWNAEHSWISFAFQGSRRWSGGINFDLHILVGSILVLLTPLGFYEVLRVLRRFWKDFKRESAKNARERRSQLFLVTFSLVPLAVFIIHSLQGQPKLNWTGPVWLSLLPLIAAGITSYKLTANKVKRCSVARYWVVTATVLLVFYAGGFGYLVAGMPGPPENHGMDFPIAWHAYGDRIENIEMQLEQDTDSEPIIIGLDQYWLASEAGFYDVDDGDSFPETAGENLIGGEGLMWDYWVAPNSVAGRNGIMVSFTEDRLNQSWVKDRFTRLGNITKEVLSNCDGEIGCFYWRIGYDYRPAPLVPSTRMTLTE